MHEAAKARQIIQERELPLADVWTAFTKTNPTAGPGTLKNYQRHLNELISWLGDNYPACQSFTDITPEIVEEYCQHLWQSGISANTYNYKRNSIGHIAKSLSASYGVDASPWSDPKLRRREVKQQRKPLTCKQSIELLNSLPEADLPCKRESVVLLWFLLYTGTRLADAINMQWSCIDLDRARLEYTPRKTPGKGKVAEVPLVPTLVTRLAQIKSDAPAVFPELAALYDQNPNTIRKPLVDLIQSITGDGRAKNPAGQRMVNRAAYGIHSLRATFATQAAMSGCKPVWLARMLGDAIETVDRYYVQAGIGDTLLGDFDHLPRLTSGGGGADPDRERLKNLAEALPIEQVRKMLWDFDAQD